MSYLRFYHSCLPITLKLLYILFVRNMLLLYEWDPYLMKHIEAIESVQRFAIKVCIYKKYGIIYRECLHMLNLPTLEARHHALKMCYLYI